METTRRETKTKHVPSAWTVPVLRKPGTASCFRASSFSEPVALRGIIFFPPMIERSVDFPAPLPPQDAKRPETGASRQVIAHWQRTPWATHSVGEKRASHDKHSAAFLKGTADINELPRPNKRHSKTTAQNEGATHVQGAQAVASQLRRHPKRLRFWCV